MWCLQDRLANSEENNTPGDGRYSKWWVTLPTPTLRVTNLLNCVWKNTIIYLVAATGFLQSPCNSNLACILSSTLSWSQCTLFGFFLSQVSINIYWAFFLLSPILFSSSFFLLFLYFFFTNATNIVFWKVYLPFSEVTLTLTKLTPSCV